MLQQMDPDAHTPIVVLFFIKNEFDDDHEPVDSEDTNAIGDKNNRFRRLPGFCPTLVAKGDESDGSFECEQDDKRAAHFRKGLRQRSDSPNHASPVPATFSTMVRSFVAYVVCEIWSLCQSELSNVHVCRGTPRPAQRSA